MSFNFLGAISVTNIAIPRATGTAIKMAKKEVSKVPTNAGAAPKTSFTGSH